MRVEQRNFFLCFAELDLFSTSNSSAREASEVNFSTILCLTVNSKSSFQIVDLGGGRGTLLSDIKRVNSDNSISFGFLEINKKLII